MTDNPKARMIEHRKNKTKYKDTLKDKQKVKKKLVPQNRAGPNRPQQLESNWDRYSESPSSDQEKCIPTPFSILADIPISQGSHFQFKADANPTFEIDNSSLYSSQLFNLDLNLLSLSLSTIPYVDRCGIPSSYFTRDQNVVMRRIAEDRLNMYETHLKTNVNKSKSGNGVTKLEGCEVQTSRTVMNKESPAPDSPSPLPSLRQNEIKEDGDNFFDSGNSEYLSLDNVYPPQPVSVRVDRGIELASQYETNKTDDVSSIKAEVGSSLDTLYVNEESEGKLSSKCSYNKQIETLYKYSSTDMESVVQDTNIQIQEFIKDNDYNSNPNGNVEETLSEADSPIRSRTQEVVMVNNDYLSSDDENVETLFEGGEPVKSRFDELINVDNEYPSSDDGKLEILSDDSRRCRIHEVIKVDNDYPDCVDGKLETLFETDEPEKSRIQEFIKVNNDYSSSDDDKVETFQLACGDDPSKFIAHDVINNNEYSSSNDEKLEIFFNSDESEGSEIQGGNSDYPSPVDENIQTLFDPDAPIRSTQGNVEINDGSEDDSGKKSFTSDESLSPITRVLIKINNDYLNSDDGKLETLFESDEPLGSGIQEVKSNNDCPSTGEKVEPLSDADDPVKSRIQEVIEDIYNNPIFGDVKIETIFKPAESFTSTTPPENQVPNELEQWLEDILDE